MDLRFLRLASQNRTLTFASLTRLLKGDADRRGCARIQIRRCSRVLETVPRDFKGQARCLVSLGARKVYRTVKFALIPGRRREGTASVVPEFRPSGAKGA